MQSPLEELVKKQRGVITLSASRKNINVIGGDDSTSLDEVRLTLSTRFIDDYSQILNTIESNPLIVSVHAEVPGWSAEYGSNGHFDTSINEVDDSESKWVYPYIEFNHLSKDFIRIVFLSEFTDGKLEIEFELPPTD